MRKFLDLIVAIGIAIANILWTQLAIRQPVIGIILALPLVFILPGYTLTEVFFHKRPLSLASRLVFGLSLSVAITILSGLILNLLPIGLQATSWATTLALLTIVFALLAMYLQRNWITTPLPRFRFSLSKVILFGLATTVAIFSLWYSTLGVIQQPRPNFTQLWMIPATSANTACAVHIGLRSFEATTVTYRMTMNTVGTRVTTWSPITLVPNATWDQIVPVPSSTTQDIFVNVQLYRLDQPKNVYRKVNLTLHNCVTHKSLPST